jgi:hypothetical protein
MRVSMNITGPAQSCNVVVDVCNTCEIKAIHKLYLATLEEIARRGSSVRGRYDGTRTVVEKLTKAQLVELDVLMGAKTAK